MGLGCPSEEVIQVVFILRTGLFPCFLLLLVLVSTKETFTKAGRQRKALDLTQRSPTSDWNFRNSLLLCNAFIKVTFKQILVRHKKKKKL